MHILMINDYFGFSAGAFAVAWEMSQEFMNRGHKVSFLCAVEKGEEGLETIQGREVVRLRVKTHYRLRPLATIHRPGLVNRAMRWVEELQPDLVHGHVLHLHLSFGLARALDKMGLPVILTAHDTGIFCPTKYVCRPPEHPDSPATARDCAACLRFRYLPGRATVTTRMVNRHVKAVVAVSQALAGILKANRVERVEVIRNGLDPDRLAREGWSGEKFREEKRLGEDPLILFGGRLHRLKGDEEALRALAGISGRFPVKLVIAGQKELFNRRLKNLARELRIEDRIVLAGWAGKGGDAGGLSGRFGRTGSFRLPGSLSHGQPGGHGLGKAGGGDQVRRNAGSGGSRPDRIYRGSPERGRDGRRPGPAFGGSGHGRPDGPGRDRKGRKQVQPQAPVRPLYGALQEICLGIYCGYPLTPTLSPSRGEGQG